MAQYIRTHFDGSIIDIEQVNQTVYHNERVITIDFDSNTNRVVVQNNGETFWLTSPDIAAITMRNVFEHLGIAHEQIVITYPEEENIHNVLDSPVHQAPLNQMAIYPNNQPIPAQHATGPFPAVAGDPVPYDDFGAFQNAPDAIPQPDDDDNNSELSDLPNYRILDRFNDSDDEHRYD